MDGKTARREKVLHKQGFVRTEGEKSNGAGRKKRTKLDPNRPRYRLPKKETSATEKDALLANGEQEGGNASFHS